MGRKRKNITPYEEFCARKNREIINKRVAELKKKDDARILNEGFEKIRQRMNGELR